MGKITYHQQVSKCGKSRCRKCSEGFGHGPYWYAYEISEDGHIKRSYVGKELPPDVQASLKVAMPSEPAHKDEPSLRIYTLGQFRLERRGPNATQTWQTVNGPAWQHRYERSVLGCLVSASGHKVGREQIIDALWPDLDVETGKSRLDRVVYNLRQLVEPGRKRFGSSLFLHIESDLLVLDCDLLWIDADAFIQLVSQANKCEDPGRKEMLLEEASTLYGGDYLPDDLKDEWTLALRSILRRQWISLLLDLADLRTAREALNGAIEPLERLLSSDPTNEAATQRLMCLLAQLGRRSEALRAYKRLADVLQRQYRVIPLPGARALYEAIRAGEKASWQVASFSSTGGDSFFTNGEGGHREASLRNSPVGRDKALEQLCQLLSGVEQSTRFRLTTQKRSSAYRLNAPCRPQCALVFGTLGMGKTCLAEEVSRVAFMRGWAIASSRTYAQSGNIPYQLWTELLRRAMAQTAWQHQEISKRPLVFHPLSALLPEIQNMLPVITYPSSISSEQEHLRLWTAVYEMLILLSENTPLLIVLDGLQWADTSSCELLAYIVRHLPGRALALVVTCRKNEIATNHSLRLRLADLQRESTVDTIQLGSLDDAHITALISRIADLPKSAIEEICLQAAGKPFFAEGLALAFKTRLSASEPTHISSLKPLPETIIASFDLSLAQLSPACRHLLSQLAVLGNTFEFQGAFSLATHSTEESVLSLLEEALKWGILTEEASDTRICYRFWHPLLASYLRDSLSAARRLSLQRRVREALHQIGNEPKANLNLTVSSQPSQIARY